MALKKNISYTRADKLPDDNAERISSTSQTTEQKKANAGSVMCLAQMLDAIAKGEVTHFTLGQPRQGGTFLLTANMPDGSKQFVGFKDVYSFGSDVLDELFVA